MTAAHTHTPVLPVGTTFIPVRKRGSCVYGAQGHAHALLLVCVHLSTHAAPVPHAHSPWRTRLLIAPAAPHPHRACLHSLQYNSIGDDGARALAAALQHCPNLQTL